MLASEPGYDRRSSLTAQTKITRDRGDVMSSRRLCTVINPNPVGEPNNAGASPGKLGYSHLCVA